MEERKRVRQACQPCQTRKRRCDGQEPCSVCIRLDDECYYEHRPRKKTKKPEISQVPTPQSPVVSTPPTYGRGNDPAVWEAYSATALPSRVEQRLVSIRYKRDLSAWNFGARQLSNNVGPRLEHLLSSDQALSLADTFFGSVGLLYRFIDEAKFTEHIKRRFETEVETPDDVLILVVALIGSYFATGVPNLQQTQIFEALDFHFAREATAEVPQLEIGAAMLLRAIYLRATSTPCASWRASCESIHALEVTKAHNVGSTLFDRDRLYWMAHIYQSWISNEFGRPNLRLFTTAEVNEYQFDDAPIFVLFKASRWLNMEIDPDDQLLGRLITKCRDMDFHEDIHRLFQAYLGVEFFRYMRLRTEHISPATVGEVLELGTIGFDAIREIVAKNQPWWHAILFPFQFLSAMLVIDTPIALERVGEALDTIQLLAEKFPSENVFRTLEKSQKMVQLLRKRKQEEFDVLGRALKIPKPVQPLPSHQPNAYASGPSHAVPMDMFQGIAPGSDLLNFGGIDWFTFDESMLHAYDNPLPAYPPR